MTNNPPGIPEKKVVIDRILESAVVLSWKDLLLGSQKGLIRIEYSPGTTLPYLKIWQLAGKGEWNLVCEYWMAGGNGGTPLEGATFSNGYHSAGLAGMLQVIMQHQNSFFPSAWKTGTGLIQVTLPTEQEKLEATAYMKSAYDSLGLTFTHIPEPAMA